MPILPPFEAPPAPLAPVLDSLAGFERVVRALFRRAGRGVTPWSAGDLGRLRTRQSPFPAAGGEVPPKPISAPLVVLPAVAWDYRVQRPQQLARSLARLGHPVLYVEGFLRTTIQPRVRGVPALPGVLRLRLRIPSRPDPYREVLSATTAELLAERIVRALGRAPRAVLCQLPFWGPLAARLRARLGVPIVYDRLDLHAGFPGVPEAVATAEADLIATADLVTATAPALLPGPSARPGPSALVANGVALEDFRLARPAPEPVRIGYVGALADWFDAPAIGRLARERPSWELLLAGRVESAEVRALGALPNVRLLGELPYPRVAGFLEGLHAFLIPFRDLPLTRAVDPVKVYEALAAGLPVVARDLPALARWKPPYLYPYREPGEIVTQVDRALAEAQEVPRETRRALVGSETWDQRARRLLSLLP